MKKPIISIVIPTYRQSKAILGIPLESIANQRCPKEYYEVVISDNEGGESIKLLAKQYGAKIIEVDGKPPQVCRQVNLGAREGRGDYIFVLDHDIELSPDFLENTIKLIKNQKDVDAWYVPYKIIARGSLLNKVRNFEEYFYRDSVIAAARIIKKSIFLKTQDQYDPRLSSGPADWDLTNQLKFIGARFSYINSYVYHHEEQLNLLYFISKKTIYAEGGEIYKEKWRKRSSEIFNKVVKKQYDPFYRLVWIFIENGKWRSLMLNLHWYLLFLVVKVTMSAVYLYSLIRK